MLTINRYIDRWASRDIVEVNSSMGKMRDMRDRRYARATERSSQGKGE